MRRFPHSPRSSSLAARMSSATAFLAMAYSRVDDHAGCQRSGWRSSSTCQRQLADRHGQSFFMQEQYALTAALVKTLINEDPENAQYWEIQANAYIGLGEFMKAAENFEVLDGMGKSTAASLNMLADIYMNEELYELAVENYAKAMTLDPEASPKRPIRAAKMLVARSANKQSEILLDAIDRIKGDALDSDIRRDLLKIRARMSPPPPIGPGNRRRFSPDHRNRPTGRRRTHPPRKPLQIERRCRAGDLLLPARFEGLDAFEADAKLAARSTSRRRIALPGSHSRFFVACISSPAARMFRSFSRPWRWFGEEPLTSASLQASAPSSTTSISGEFTIPEQIRAPASGFPMFRSLLQPRVRSPVRAPVRDPVREQYRREVLCQRVLPRTAASAPRAVSQARSRSCFTS